MTTSQSRRLHPAPGGPGMEPRWTRGAKDAVGSAYSTASRVWYTISGGCLNEVYYPTIDEPQIRDLQFMITDGKTFFQDERRSLETEIECISAAALGFKITNSDPVGRYQLHKKLIGDPHQNCILIETRITGQEEILKQLQFYVICAPHLEIGGWGNSGEVLEISGRKILTAHKGNTWLALAASVPFDKCSCGYVGVNDGWGDLATDFQTQHEFDYAADGNIALTGKLDLKGGREFITALSFGRSLHDAVNTLFQSLSVSFDLACQTFLSQWKRPSKRIVSFPARVMDNSRLLETSVNLLLAHEDKEFPGAMIAALSIPWGEDKGDEELGGYHLVWTRDLVNSVSALLAADDTSTPLRALIYLAVSQREDGGFYQNFWIDGRPYWQGVQLDEVAFPIMLAWRLNRLKALRNFDPYRMVLRAASYLIREGPTSPQERWEEAAGFSPSTLAANIAGLICASDFMRQNGDTETADFVAEYADFLESHVEAWTVTTQGALYPGIARHFIRINPPSMRDGVRTDEDPNQGTLRIANHPFGENCEFPAKDIVDAGFLELVRYGIRRAGDPLIEDSLRVVDSLLKVDTPVGPCWKRYNHDGYGQRDDGTSFQGWGTGRPWPLLTGERGHYEVAAGRSGEPHLRAMEGFAHGIGLLPEQIWDAADIREYRMKFAGPTGAAIPLMWAHAEYVKLLKSVVDGRVFDLLPPVAERYLSASRKPVALEVWKFNRQVQRMKPGGTLRVLCFAPFRLRFTLNAWTTAQDVHSKSNSTGVQYVDIAVTATQKVPIHFTFFWVGDERWEGKDFSVQIADS